MAVLLVAVATVTLVLSIPMNGTTVSSVVVAILAVHEEVTACRPPFALSRHVALALPCRPPSVPIDVLLVVPKVLLPWPLSTATTH